MGIPKLWDLLTATEEKWLFNEFTISEGFLEVKGFGKIIGVDISLWLWRAQKVFGNNHAQYGQNPELRTIFFMLAWLYRNAVKAIFVFDGVNRPSVKRNTRVSMTPHWMVSKVQEMIVVFGFQWYTAPGEAEAELAHLNYIGTIDAVLTDDGDTFLFGALCIVRNPVQKKDRGFVSVYRASVIQESEGLKLTRGGMILIGLLVGGDYDTVGLRGCGILTAQKIARTGMGDTLLTAALTLSSPNFLLFLIHWRETLRYQLANDPAQVLGSIFPTLAISISDTFPKPEIVLAYASPNTSWSNGAQGPNLNLNLAHQLDIRRLAGLCEAFFGWPDVPKRFRTLIFPGSALRMLCEDHSTFPLPSFTISAVLEILRVKTSVSGLKQYYIKISTATLTTAAKSGLLVDPDSSNATFDRMWVPAVILEQALPIMVQQYEIRKGKGKGKGKDLAIAGPCSGAGIELEDSTDDNDNDTTLLAAYLNVDSDSNSNPSDDDTTRSSQTSLMVINPIPPPNPPPLSNFLGHIDLTASGDNDVIIPPSDLGHIDLSGIEVIDLSLDESDEDTSMQKDTFAFTTTYIDLTTEE